MAGVTRLLAGQREALWRPGVDQWVMLVVTDHHLLQARTHGVVLEGPRSGLKMAGSHRVVVMRRLLAPSWPRTHQLLGWRIAWTGLVMIVTNLVKAVRVRGSSTRWSLHRTAVHDAGTLGGGHRPR